MHHVSLHCCLAEILEVGRFLLRRGQNAEFFILVYFLLFTSMVQVSAGCCSVGEMVSFLFFQL